MFWKYPEMYSDYYVAWGVTNLNCIWEWTTLNNVNGYKVTSKKNGNSIFLPAAGCRYDNLLMNESGHGFYWSSSLDTTGPSNAYYVYFNSSNVDWYGGSRYFGQSVRPVCP